MSTEKMPNTIGGIVLDASFYGLILETGRCWLKGNSEKGSVFKPRSWVKLTGTVRYDLLFYQTDSVPKNQLRLLRNLSTGFYPRSLRITDQSSHSLHDLPHTRAIGIFKNRREWYRYIGRSDSYNRGLEMSSESFLDAGRDFGVHPAGFRAFFDNNHAACLFY